MTLSSVKLVQTVNQISFFSGAIVGSGGGGGGGLTTGRTINIEKAISSGYVIVNGYAPYKVVGNTASHAATVWTAVSGGSQITDLKNWDGSTASSLSTDVDGAVFFQAPVANNTLYVDLGATRIRVDRIFTISHTHAISDVTNLQTSIDSKADISHNHNATYQALTGKDAANGYAGLSASSKLATSQIPDISATYVAVATVGANSGVAGLDVNGVVPAANSLVSSVNSNVGDVLIDPASIGAYTQAETDALIGSTTAVLKVVMEVSSVYALRNTVSTNSSIPVVWIGPDAPTIGSGYAINNVDIWFVKS